MAKNNKQSLTKEPMNDNKRPLKNDNNEKPLLSVETEVTLTQKVGLITGMICAFLVGVVMVGVLTTQLTKPVGLKVPEISSFNITLTSNDYQISKPDKDGYQEITMIDFKNNTREPGEPYLPMRTYQVLMPAGAKFKSLEIVSKESEVIEGKFTINYAPTPQPIAPLEEANEDNTNNDLPYKMVPEVPPKKEIYQSDNPYPQNIVEPAHQGKMRKFDIFPLNFSPIQYKPLSKELTLFKSVTIRIIYEKGQKPEEKLLNDTVINQDVNNLVLNYDQFANDYKPISAPKSATYHYIIITPQSLASSTGMTNLVNYRQGQGYLVKVETTEYINSSYSGADLPEKIRNYLIAKYLTWGFKYVALVGTGGTTSVIPLRYCYWGSEWGEYFPTDYYYQDLTGIWDPSQYLCGSNTDFYPEVYVGRIPLDSSTQLESYVNRLITYEGSNDPYKKRALLAAGIWALGWDAADTADYLRNNTFLPNGYQTVRMYEETGTCPCNLPHDYDVSEENVVNHWRDDHYGVVYLAAHGNPYKFCSKPCPPPDGCQTIFHRDDISQLSNNYPSVVFGNACSTADPDDSDNLGYKFIRQAGVSYVGNVRVGWANDVIYGYYFENLINNKLTNGKALAQARLTVSNDKCEALNANLYSEPLLNLTSYNLEIMSPEANQVFYNVDTISIEGTVFGQDFNHYIIEWGEGANPSTWSTQGIILENSGNQVKIEELLGTWDVSSITTSGDYTLKLTGYFDSNNYTSTVTFHIDNQICSDGTLPGECSVTYPLYCENGQLTEWCQGRDDTIGTEDDCCPEGYYCQPEGNCLEICSDGTLPKTCSATKPLYCNENGELVSLCTGLDNVFRTYDDCGCINADNICYKDNSCVVPQANDGLLYKYYVIDNITGHQYLIDDGINPTIDYCCGNLYLYPISYDTDNLFRWEGSVKIDNSNQYIFYIFMQSDNSVPYTVKLYLDNLQTPILSRNGFNENLFSVNINLISGWHNIKLEAVFNCHFCMPPIIGVQLGWKEGSGNVNTPITINDIVPHDHLNILSSCSDGTLSGQCNANRQYCNNGNLVNDCLHCGCASGCCERTNNQCSNTCIDGTPIRSCSTNKPKYCGMQDQNFCYLFDACPACGCPDVKDANGVPKYYCKTNKGSMAGECAINPAYCDSKPVMYLPFNEGNGNTTTYDQTCYHNNGTITGATWVTGYGGTGYALSFDGNDDRVVVPYKNSLSVSKEIIISARVKFNNLPNRDYSTIVKGPAYMLRFLRNPARLQGIVIEKDTANPYIIISNKTDWVTNTWYDIAFIYDGHYLRLYINGTQDNYQQLNNIEIAKGSSNLSVGNGYSIQFGWVEGISGVVDDVKIYPTTDGMAFPVQAEL